MNDPNGLVYHLGEFHLFYQYNPYGHKWGPMSWGHAVSSDLIHWEHLPVAIEEENGTMIFSGSAVIDEGNKSGLCDKPGSDCMVAIYTSHIEDSLEYQSIAFSKDLGRSWQKYHRNPILDIGKQDFRDPKVFWHSASNRWIMVVALPTEFKVQFYSTTNLIDWRFLSEFGNKGNTSKIWECPDFFPLEANNGTNTKTKWVLIVSAGGPQQNYGGVQYFIGDFDGTSFVLDEEFKAPKWVDHGKDFYAAVTFNGLPNNRVLLGWANSWTYAEDVPTFPWKGAMAFPRELSLLSDHEGSYRLRQQPVSKLTILREEGHRFRDIRLVNQEIEISNLSGLSMELNIQFQPIDATEFGIAVFQGDHHQTRIFYQPDNEQLIFDRSNSGNLSFNAEFSSIDTVGFPLEDGLLNLRIMIDHSLVEIYAQNGQATLVNQVFPGRESAISWFASQGTAVVKKAEIWKLRSIW